MIMSAIDDLGENVIQREPSRPYSLTTTKPNTNQVGKGLGRTAMRMATKPYL
jgi:hypothetical protein